MPCRPVMMSRPDKSHMKKKKTKVPTKYYAKLDSAAIGSHRLGFFGFGFGLGLGFWIGIGFEFGFGFNWQRFLGPTAQLMQSKTQYGALICADLLNCAAYECVRVCIWHGT